MLWYLSESHMLSFFTEDECKLRYKEMNCLASCLAYCHMFVAELFEKIYSDLCF